MPLCTTHSHYFGYLSRKGVDTLYSDSILTFWAAAIVFPVVAVPFHTHANYAQEFKFSLKLGIFCLKNPIAILMNVTR